MVSWQLLRFTKHPTTELSSLVSCADCLSRIDHLFTKKNYVKSQLTYCHHPRQESEGSVWTQIWESETSVWRRRLATRTRMTRPRGCRGGGRASPRSRGSDPPRRSSSRPAPPPARHSRRPASPPAAWRGRHTRIFTMFEKAPSLVPILTSHSRHRAATGLAPPSRTSNSPSAIAARILGLWFDVNDEVKALYR